MVQFLGVIAALLLISFHGANPVQAETWDLGYTNTTPEVEEIPDTISDLNADEKSDIIETTDLSPEEDQEKPPIRPSSSSITKISTAQNTFGVETVEKPGLKLFLSPVAGLSSILGNGTVDVTPQYAFGGRAGLLISDNMMVEGGYTYSLINTSAPINFLMGSASTNMFDLKQSSFDAGAKFFFLGRESRFRPFIGGGLAFSNSTLNFTQTYNSMLGLTDDYKIKQFQGIGQLGAEIAITRGIVATAAFRFNGILSSSVQSIKNASTATGLEANKIQAGESLSRSASYTGSVGVGVYF